MNKKIKLASIIFVLFLSTLTVAYAAVTWTQTGSFTFAQASMTVTSNPAGTSLDLGTVTASTIKTVTYTVTNNGPVAITIAAAVTKTGCDAVLSPTSGGLQPGQSATLTLKLGNFTATGTYSVTITAT